ncbi:MAG: universal stress protein [Verrucomicrobiae bacterium]|nr:universal stress protein [Verrucomicrobiae bacterium]
MKAKTRPTSTRTTSPPALEFNAILVPVDFSPRSRRATQYAAALAQQFDAALELLFVLEPLPTDSMLERPQRTRGDTELARRAETMLRELAQTEVPSGVRATTRVRRGKAAPEIIATAQQGQSDLIVLSSHGYSGVQRLLLGSTAEQVVRHAPCSVLTLREHAAAPTRIRRILAPVDFSPASRAALRYAVEFAGLFDADLTVFHAVLSLPPPRRLSAFARGLEVEALKQAREDLATLVKTKVCGAIPVATKIAAGVPRDAIVRVAGRLKTDLIIMATQGKKGLERWVMGSTAELVVRHAPCPVLVLRPG